MCTYFKIETDEHSIGRSLNEKKKDGGTRLVSEKTEILYAELNEEVEAATSSYSATFTIYLFCACD